MDAAGLNGGSVLPAVIVGGVLLLLVLFVLKKYRGRQGYNLLVVEDVEAAAAVPAKGSASVSLATFPLDGDLSSGDEEDVYKK